eukprot:Phypoly_transcript_02943.p1 GENE.Phypoly_transcript_02943~~Phypoly_transcript_02943.p1  ORF type:complete len:806 (+),score=214.03 Phypoly_transcript_02943:160-2577(+)
MKKTPQQLEWILAEAERVNSVLVNDYTSLKEKVKNLTESVQALQKEKATLEESNRNLVVQDSSQKEDIDRLNLIVEFEREQRFDWEQKNDMLILQMNATKISLMGMEDKVKQQQETIRQQLESLQAKDELLEQHARKIATLEEGMKGLKSNFDDMYRQYTESRAQLETIEGEKEQYLQKLSASKQGLAQARESISEMETRISEHDKLIEMEQAHRCTLETQMDDLQKHNRRLVQQVADVTAKDKASEKMVEDLKMQITQLERVRDHLTSLLDKDKHKDSEKTPKGPHESPAEEERKLRSSQEHDLSTQSLRSEVEEKNKAIGVLEVHVASLEHKYSQLETEKAELVSETNQLVQKLSEEIDELKSKQDARSRQEREREWSNKIKVMDEALQEERERVRKAEESIIELRKKHRDDLEQLQTRTENGNGTEEHEKAPNGLVEQKLKQNLEEEKLELEKMTNTLSENRIRYKEELEKFRLEKSNFIDEAQRWEELKRDLEEREQVVATRKEELQELEKEIQEMAVKREEIAAAEKKLRAEEKSFEEIKLQVEADKKLVEDIKKELEEEKSKIAQLKAQSEQELKALAGEREQVETEKKTLAEEKADIDNELQRLVEQRLEMQQMKQAYEDKESHFLITVKERDAKLEELTHSLAEERKQKEKLEAKFSATQKSPDSKDSLSFSYFKSRKNKEKEPEATSLDGTPPPADNLTDEERKMKLFNEYQVLLTEINTTLFEKREQVADTEKSGGGGLLKKMGLSSLKSSITKLEDLQGRVKKGFRALDDKPACSPSDEASEHTILKAFRNELT